MALQVFVAYILDLLVGDPLRLPHPVVLMGKCISKLEMWARQLFQTPVGLKISGIVIVVILVGGSYGVTLLVLILLSRIHPVLAYVAGIWLISTTIAVRGLSRAGDDIRILLAQGKLKAARDNVGMVVGRDSHSMDSKDVARATIETIAENTVDAAVAPLFYAYIAGPPGAMAYRAVNTLDSMLGYKDERYIHLGWAAAKLDDLANYIPARLTGAMMLLTIWLTGRDIKGGWKALIKDSARHPSPNAGIPESVVAGALNIRLGGLNYYRGKPSFRSYMGCGSPDILPGQIRPAVDIMLATSFYASLSGFLVHLFL